MCVNVFMREELHDVVQRSLKLTYEINYYIYSDTIIIELEKKKVFFENNINN